MSGKKSFLLLYLKSISVKLNDEINEEKLLDYMNRDQRRKSIADRIGQVTLTLTDDAIVLSKPLWWSTKSGQQLPYTQLREAYVFGKDNKKIAIDIMSTETQQRRVLLFKTRNLDERETLIELLTQRKMAREMYEKDNIRQVEYANWKSTYANDGNRRPSGSQSPVSLVSEQSAPESPVFTKPRAHSLARQPMDQPRKYSIPEAEPAEMMQLVPVNPTRPLREISYQSEQVNMDSGRRRVEPWRGGDDGRQPLMVPYCSGHCNHNHKPSEQHTNINIVFQGQPGLGTISTEPGPNPSQMNTYLSHSPHTQTSISPDEIRIHPVVDARQTPLSHNTPSQWDYTENTIGNNVRFAESQESPVSVSYKSMGSNYSLKQNPSQRNMYGMERNNSTSGSNNQTASQPDLTIRFNGKEAEPSVKWDESPQSNKKTYTNAYNVTTIPSQGSKSGKSKEHTYHTTLITKAGGNSAELNDWKFSGSRSTDNRIRDQVIEERTINNTSQGKPQQSCEVLIMRSPSMTNLAEAHHGWATQTKFYEVRSNSLAKVTRNGSRYVTLSTQRSEQFTSDNK
ncbi:hypothetical protein D915_000284 [Fasciola hepatica]|uniref:Uncharacterized protein n=1 Tax=Fasciola hepatica TaxID=6192 RepID=A0A4E0RMM2_FASHE|nr:hypothetical protein D915_000284 [Fasciola hepatica]